MIGREYWIDGLKNFGREVCCKGRVLGSDGYVRRRVIERVLMWGGKGRGTLYARS